MKILLLLLLGIAPIFLLPTTVTADTNNLYHSALLGNSTLYISRFNGNDDFGQFFEDILEDFDKVLKRTKWFNTKMFNEETTTGAISHFLLLFIIIGTVIVSEVSKIPAFMFISGLSVFFFSFLIILSISILIGSFITIFSLFYSIRSITFIKE